MKLSADIMAGHGQLEDGILMYRSQIPFASRRSIPTLSVGGMILFGLLLLGGGIVFLSAKKNPFLKN